MKRAVIVFASACTLLAILVAPRFATTVLFSTVSPRQRYTVEVSQYSPFPFYERAVFLNVHRDGRADSKGNRQFSITVRGGNIAIESPQADLRQSRCCASDRPDPEHEWSY